ncbi:hypothetical protein SVIO_035950 [Streptomyces violaceusniger]|uniref:Uncharacterized protein n=1 Tax=Streptomyces violaceusniger TaxID=68280 RepID=A0A4D4KW55_STRVO|nr:hypothetical protein SVIO_035950 [Streptomyces violaceusniger]
MGKSDSMPKVRASSGTIGTQRFPVSFSRIRSLTSRTKAMVVAISWLPEPLASVWNGFADGSGRATGCTRRAGAGPPRAARRSWR